MPEPTKRVALPERRRKLAEHARAEHVVVPEPGTPFEALLDEGYWCHVARRLTEWDTIHVHYQDDDGAYYARLLVRAKGDLWARVSVIEKHDLDAVEPRGVSADRYKVKYLDPHNRYGVIDTQTGKRLIEGLQGRADADRWVANHVKSLAA